FQRAISVMPGLVLACPGHPRPRLFTSRKKTWMAGTSPAMTTSGSESMDSFVASLLAMTIERPCAPSASLRAQAKQSIQAQKEDGIASWFSLQCANASPFVAGNDLARVVPAKAGTHNHRCSRLDDSDADS